MLKLISIPGTNLLALFSRDTNPIFYALYSLVYEYFYIFFYICIHIRYLLIVSLRAVLSRVMCHKMNYVASQVDLNSWIKRTGCSLKAHESALPKVLAPFVGGQSRQAVNQFLTLIFLCLLEPILEIYIFLQNYRNFT